MARRLENRMKIISATIRSLDWDAACAALNGVGVGDIDCAEVQVFGRGGGRAELYRGAQFIVDHVPQIRIYVTAEDHLVARVIEAIEVVNGAGDHDQYAVQRLVDWRDID
jgi:nitrogen regulatory protein P-II 1